MSIYLMKLTQGERTQGKRTQGVRKQGERTQGDRTQGDPKGRPYNTRIIFSLADYKLRSEEGSVRVDPHTPFVIVRVFYGISRSGKRRRAMTRR